MKAPISMSKRERILGGLWGSLVGDALGVPVEFKDRATVQADPVKDMREFGTHHQPRGTWSDDGALILCTTESLLNHEFDLNDMGERFVRWMNQGYWTATGDVFDIGGATSSALLRIAKGIPADQAGGQSKESNGNGSLMRILPVALRFSDKPAEVIGSRLEITSSITHGHPRSKMACAFFGFFTSRLLLGWKPHAALEAARVEFTRCYEHTAEFGRFDHILNDDLVSLPEGEVVSTGYVLHTLHASLWCLLTTAIFEECVLKAVNLGGDTDTTGCVAGGLAGVLYGLNAIPEKWIQSLARRSDVETLFNDFAQLIETKP
jgi:ADP-ribosyl-[dinitrogen reductase] hydrolase